MLSLQAADLSKPIDKRIYKGTQPTCHDFNHLTATAESVSLLVGFSAGQVQLIDPIKKETSKLFNEEVSRSLNVVACNVFVILEILDSQISVDGSICLYNLSFSHSLCFSPVALAWNTYTKMLFMKESFGV